MKKQPRIDRSCERCGSAFVAKQSDVDKGNGRFCSRICHVKSPKRPKTQQACEQCGKEWRQVEAPTLREAMAVAERMPDVAMCVEASVVPGGVAT